MKTSTFLCSILVLSAVLFAEDDPRENIVILSESAVENLRIETQEAERRIFESTLFAIGHLEEIPSRRSVLSSRIAGRVIEINVFTGDRVEKGQVLVRVESRQPGNPPPSIDLRAPRSGIVVESHVRIGQPVTPDIELLDIGDRSVLWGLAKIPEAELAKVQPGMPARIRIPAGGDEVIEAKLVRYGVEADRASGTVEGVFELPNPDGKLQPGMRAEFNLVTGWRENVLCVPREAVQGDPTRRVLFVKDYEIPNGFIPFPVVLGEENDDYVEVVKGIFPNDEVVTKGSYPLAFAGGSGMSLKEALDAAHGHEHNEDGSEMSDDQKAAKKGEDGTGSGGGIPTSLVVGSKPLLIYAAVVTALALLLFQLLWNQLRKRNLQRKNELQDQTLDEPSEPDVRPVVPSDHA